MGGITTWSGGLADLNEPQASVQTGMAGWLGGVGIIVKCEVTIRIPPRGTAMDWFSGFGLPIYPPSRHDFSWQ